MGERLAYRGHEAADVPPVLVERGGGRVRVVVSYPPAGRVRARNRFVIAAGVAVASVSSGWVGVRSGHVWLAWAGSLSFWFVVAAVVMGLVWVRSGLTHVIEVDGRRLCVETRGRWRTRRRCCGRERVREVGVATGRRGRVVAVVIRTTEREVGGRYFEYLDERFIREIVEALREGLR